MKNILLQADEKFFFKLKKDKLKLEIKLNKKINWEQYFKILFEMK